MRKRERERKSETERDRVYLKVKQRERQKDFEAEKKREREKEGEREGERAKIMTPNLFSRSVYGLWQEVHPLLIRPHAVKMSKSRIIRKKDKSFSMVQDPHLPLVKPLNPMRQIREGFRFRDKLVRFHQCS